MRDLGVMIDTNLKLKSDVVMILLAYFKVLCIVTRLGSVFRDSSSVFVLYIRLILPKSDFESVV